MGNVVDEVKKIAKLITTEVTNNGIIYETKII